MACSPNNGKSTGHSSHMSDEERNLLKSMGLLDLLYESDDSRIREITEPRTNHSNKSNIEENRKSETIPNENEPHDRNIWTKLRNLISRSDRLHSGDRPIVKAPLETESSLSSKYKEPQRNNLTLENRTILESNESTHDIISNVQMQNKVLLGIGGTLFLLPHLAILLSLPPVLQRRGAPYLPTFKSKLNTMFDLIRVQIEQQNQTSRSNLQFVDLGSGDGRVVFRAAREGLFEKSVGYEINPTLHMFAQARKLITPKYWQTTRFQCRDLWGIQLSKYDVVAVYGLAPIMDRLGAKMKKELKPGSIIVSNVFEIPGWRSVVHCEGKDGTNLSGKGIHLYRVPECFEIREQVHQVI